MPRLNRMGDLWCAGIAGAGFSGGTFGTSGQIQVVVQQSNAGGRSFLTDEIAVTQSGDSQILGLNCRTPAISLMASHGASEIQAGGGVWASFKPEEGVHTSTGLHFPAAYIGASTGPMRNECVGPDGSIALKERYHSSGPWHVYRHDGSNWLLSSNNIANLQLLDSERAIWREGLEWFGRGVLWPLPLTPKVWGLKWIETALGPWLVYQAEDGRVIAHPNGAEDGHVLGQSQNAFGLDACLLPAGIVRVIWAHTEGETPDGIVTTYFSLLSPRMPLRVVTPLPSPEEDKPMMLPNEVHAIYKAVAEKFKTMHQSNDEAVRQEAHRRGVQTLRSRGFVRYVNKSAHSILRPTTKDALAFVPLSEGVIEHGRKVRMTVFNMIDGGTRKVNSPHEGEVVEHWIVWEDPKDWLEDDVDADPEPVGTTHRFIGGGNDREPRQCDQCGKPPLDPVHAVPEGKVPHEPWLGEDGIGDCDLCFRPVDSPIHFAETVERHAYQPSPNGLCKQCGEPEDNLAFHLEKEPPEDVPAGSLDLTETNRLLVKLGEKIDKQTADIVAALKGIPLPVSKGFSFSDFILKKK